MGLVCCEVLRPRVLLLIISAVIILFICIVSIQLPTGRYHLDMEAIERIQKARQRQHDLLKAFIYNESLGAYLIPLTRGLHSKDLNDSVTQHILRSGLGLQPFRTENNEDIWIENGVEYRSFPFLEKKDNPFYTSEFEAHIPFNKSLFFEGGGDRPNINVTQKKIILWWQQKKAHAPIEGLNPLRACPDFPCVLTSDRNYTENSSAILINAQFVNGEEPPRRRDDQVLINYQIESPLDYWFYGYLFEAGKGWNHVFNWTMSYRMDADITTYHGILRKRRAAKEKDYEAILAKKKGFVAWMVSNCKTNSKRESYVQELQKYIPVDIYGHCGQLKCPRISDKKCLEDINRKYKFYLGLESNLCRDYITEKLYRYLDSDMIVIARGFNTYSRLLPSDIFINTADFNSTKDLANWLLYLDSNDQEYTKMLREKDKYFSLYEDYPLLGDKQPFMEYRYESASMCEVCKRVWNLHNYAKVYPDMSGWMYKEEYQCVSPTDVGCTYWGIIYFFLTVFTSYLIYLYVKRKRQKSFKTSIFF